MNAIFYLFIAFFVLNVIGIAVKKITKNKPKYAIILKINIHNDAFVICIILINVQFIISHITILIFCHLRESWLGWQWVGFQCRSRAGDSRIREPAGRAGLDCTAADCFFWKRLVFTLHNEPALWQHDPTGEPAWESQTASSKDKTREQRAWVSGTHFSLKQDQ